MKSSMVWLAILVLCFSILCTEGVCESMALDVKVSPMPYAGGVRNPLKGLRADNDLNTRYGTLVRWYIPWNALESNAEDGFEKLVEYGKQQWGNASMLNCKIIPRVYLEWPNVGTYWPEDMKTGDYTSFDFQLRLTTMVQKMAKAWDSDPQIAYIEMGLVGWWGEQHTPTPTDQVQNLLISLFSKYFVNKQVMVRNPLHALFQKAGFGLYWDEWGSDMQWSEWDHIDLVTTDAYKDRWKTAVFGGENTNNLYTYDPTGGRFMTYGCAVPFPAETAFAEYLPQMLKYARLTHTNHMHTRLPDEGNTALWKNVATFQDTLGYAFEIRSARFNHVGEERVLQLSFDVRNNGASPLYADWPVAVSLLSAKNNTLVWRALLPGVSASDWLPGEEWDVEANAYRVPAKVYTVEGALSLPESVAEGEYVLALSIVDPAGLRNAAVFMNAGYINGGYTALGMIGVGAIPAQKPFTAAIKAQDPVLGYDLNLALYKECTAAELTDGLNVSAWTGEGFTIDLSSRARLSSMTLAFEEPAVPFVVEVSDDGESWAAVSAEPFYAHNDRVYLPLGVKARYVRVAFAEAAALSEVSVYGQ